MNHLRVWLGCGLAAVGAAAIAQTALTGPTARLPQVGEARRPDERTGEKPLAFDLFGRPVEIGLSNELTRERRLNFDLDRTAQRGRVVTENELKVDASSRLAADTTVFLQAVHLTEHRRALRDGSVTRASGWQRGQTWVRWDRLGGTELSLQAGRVALIEPRSWWWDDDLDAVRLRWNGEPLQLDTGLARELAKRAASDPAVDPALKGVTRWFGRAGWPWAPRHTLEGFWLVQRDASGSPPIGTVLAPGREDTSDARLTWLGLRAAGEWRSAAQHRLRYRLDAASLRGRDTLTGFNDAGDGTLVAQSAETQRVRGHAIDAGLSAVLAGNARPTLSVAYARGSGGGGAAVDRRFRQTGLQENKGRLGGVKRVRFYGELLDPELSNLRVASLGFGLRVAGNNSVELLGHDYRQAVASTRVAGSRLSAAPLGLDRRLGREVDLVIALREWRHLELVLKLETFWPGPAFGELQRDPAHGVELGATLSF